LVTTRATGQPAFACYLPPAQTEIARPYAFFVLALEGERISAIKWLADSSSLAHLGPPRILR
jgi:RNA polymerase sigma-70 factor (ECF subfamily)